MTWLGVIQYLPETVARNAPWYVAGLIIVGGLLIYGLRDLLRFSPTRAWAVSGVTYTDAVRRRVLWVTVPAILGCVVVSQLQRPFDGQDAIRQTIQVCMFVSALVVVVTTLILASTNLSREIESKVVYTVVTKPATRLEIITGKLIGFARVSALTLLILGVFVWGYAHFRAWRFERIAAAENLASSSLIDPSRQLLATRTLGSPSRVDMVAAPRTVQSARGADPSFTWLLPLTQDLMLPFRLPAELLDEVRGATGGVELAVKLNIAAAELPGVVDPSRPMVALPPLPAVSVQFLSGEGFALFNPEQINRGRPIELSDPSGRAPVFLPVEPGAAQVLSRVGEFVVTVTGVQQGYLYGARAGAVELVIRSSRSGEGIVVQPLDHFAGRPLSGPLFRGKDGVFGWQLRGPEEGREMVAIFSFRNVPEAAVIDGKVPMQFRAGIERGGADADSEEITAVRVTVQNLASNQTFTADIIRPESNRTLYFAIDSEAVTGGNFDVRLYNLTAGHVVGLRENALVLVLDQRGFSWNLAKSMLLLWMASVLVASIAIFASTFLSWPIAFVLTLVILLGRWAVETLGDALGPGAGTAFAQSLFRSGSEYAQAKVVSQTVDALSKALVTLGNLLPDITAFGSNDLIERGITIPATQLVSASLVLLLFAVPLLVLAYVFLRNKEVAP